MESIFIVDDGEDIQRILKSALNRHKLIFCSTLGEARAMLALSPKVELFVLDLSLPDGNGLDLCMEVQNIPQYSQTPIIFLTGKNETRDKITGLSLGIDDYITKPFDPVELRIRVDLRIKKHLERLVQEQTLVKHDLELNISRQKAFWNSDGAQEDLQLTAFEFKLLVYLAQHEEHVLSREQLISGVWGEDRQLIDRTIDSHMSNLRKKIAPTTFTIKSVYGEGYRFLHHIDIKTKKAA
ncbi:MAG: hypothetical protein A2X86_13130 [Bdellovibrionales bacterium GWA2_49_15]|nr:MAG: hypothetical protein A2X86_13130 [Bdellovibrionales bacterium GWA2_49_15]HAZ13466.1 hypothetical protein [Bdellovibrionales bacterium]